MAPIRSIPILIGFQEGCSRLLGKSRGDDMFGILSYGRDELSPGRDDSCSSESWFGAQKRISPWGGTRSDERELIPTGRDVGLAKSGFRPTAVRLRLTLRSRFSQDCAAYRHRNRVAPRDNRQRAEAGRPSELVRQSLGISGCK
jgi:hypothetical protein